jgi:hypothetical protein
MLAPDGIPFASAGCGGPLTGGGIPDSTINVCRPCTQTYPGGDKITVHSCSISVTPGKCELGVEVSLTIETPNSCDVAWAPFCLAGCGVGGQTCGAGAGATGPTGPTTISQQLDCNCNGDNMVVWLQHASNCDCTVNGGAGVTTLVVASGTCQG